MSMRPGTRGAYRYTPREDRTAAGWRHSCEETWPPGPTCHCQRCHRTFDDVTAFDAHTCIRPLATSR